MELAQYIAETWGAPGLIIAFLAWGWFQERKQVRDLTDKLFDVSMDTVKSINDLTSALDRWRS